MFGAVDFDESACDKNPFCPAVRACKTGAIFIDPVTRVPRFAGEKCVGCGECMEFCPRGALKMA